MADSAKESLVEDAAFEAVAAPFEFFSAIEELRVAKDEVETAVALLDFEAEAAEINWDLSIEESGAGDAATIDWGIESVSDDSVIAAVGGENAIDLDTPVEIDWDITTSDVVESADVSFGVDGVTLDATSAATTGSNEATRVGLLTDNDFRTRVQNDLLELRMFLRQRKEELLGSNNVAFANQFQGTSGMYLLALVELYCSVLYLTLCWFVGQSNWSSRASS